MCWAQEHHWALDRLRVSPEDEALLHAMLHHMATNGPLDDASLPQRAAGGGVLSRHH